MKRILLYLIFYLPALTSNAQDHYWVSFPDAVTGVVNYGDHVKVQYINRRSGEECGGSTTPYQNEFMVDTHGRVDSIVSFYHLRYENNGLYVISDEYDVTKDSSALTDSNIIRQNCDTSGICTYADHIVPLDVTMDADSNYHIVGYSGSSYGYIVGPNKLIYFTATGETRATSGGYNIPGPSVSRIPVHMTSYKVLEALNGFDLYCCDPIILANIYPTHDHQFWVIRGSKYNPDNAGKPTSLEFLKFDQSGNITSDTSFLFPNDNTDSSYATVFYKTDTIQKSILIIGQVTKRTTGNFYNQTYLWEFDENGKYVSQQLFPSFEDADLYLSIKRKGYLYYPLGNDSSVIRYIDNSGDTIKSVYFPTTFNQDIVKTTNQRYIHFGFQFSYNSDTGILHSFLQMAVFDSTGKFMKQLVTPIYLNTYCEACPPPIDYIFSTSDQYDNIHFYTNFHDTRANHCSSYQADGAIINLGYINQVNGNIRDSSGTVKNIIVELQLNGQTYYTTTNDSGNYSFVPFDTGHGLIILHPDSSGYTNTSTDTIPVIISDTVPNPVINFLLRSRLTTVRNNTSGIKVSVYPNPFRNYTTLEFEYNRPTDLIITSVEGKIVQQYSGTDKYYKIYRKDLSVGMHFYELRDKESHQILDSGKIIVE